MSTTPGPLLELGAAGSLLALLICGHMLGDFVFQSAEMVRRKRETRWLLYHAGVLVLTHLACLIPFFSLRIVLAVAVIGASHATIDRLKTRLARPGADRLRYFFLDQLCHLGIVVGAWLALLRGSPEPLRIFLPHLDALTIGAIGLSAFAFNVNGGAAVVGGVLQSCALPDKDTQEHTDPQHTLRMGRLIGMLERALVLILVLVGQWGGLGLILAAKSLARFKDLEQRAFAEYYLIGTLTSVLVAVISGLLVQLLT